MQRIYNYGVIDNLIDDDSRFLNDSFGGWVPSAGNTLWRCTGVEYGPLATCAMGVRSNGQTSATVELPGVAVPRDLRAQSLRFHVLIRLSDAGKVNLTLSLTGPGAGTWQLASDFADLPTLRAGEWHLLSVVRPGSTDSVTTLERTFATLTVEARWPEAAENNLFVRNPSLCAPDTVVRNVAGVETFVRLPEYLREIDAEQTEPDYPLLRFTDVLTAVANDADDRWNQYRYIPPDLDDGPAAKASTLADPALANLQTIQWLAQLMGVPLVDPRSGVTSWGSLMSAADLAAPEGTGDGDGSPTWGEWVTALDDDAPVSFDHDDDPSTPNITTNVMDWDEIEDFNVNDTSVSEEVLLAFLRWQVATAAYGFRGGTTASILTAARFGLVSTEVDGTGSPVPPEVQIVPHAEGDPWRLQVVVRQDQIRDSSLDTIQNLLTPAAPAGFHVEAVLSE